jgi:hypothetical protein
MSKKNIMSFLSGNAYSILWILTLVFAIAPIAIYHYEISHNILNLDKWYAEGNNHGPWRYSAEGLLIFFPQFFLSALSIFALVFTSSNKTPIRIILTILLIIMQIFIYISQWAILGSAFN